MIKLKDMLVEDNQKIKNLKNQIKQNEVEMRMGIVAMAEEISKNPSGPYDNRAGKRLADKLIKAYEKNVGQFMKYMMTLTKGIK